MPSRHDRNDGDHLLGPLEQRWVLAHYCYAPVTPSLMPRAACPFVFTFRYVGKRVFRIVHRAARPLNEQHALKQSLFVSSVWSVLDTGFLTATRIEELYFTGILITAEGGICGAGGAVAP